MENITCTNFNLQNKEKNEYNQIISKTHVGVNTQFCFSQRKQKLKLANKNAHSQPNDNKKRTWFRGLSDKKTIVISENGHNTSNF